MSATAPEMAGAAGEATRASTRLPRVAGVVLAAGGSLRFGSGVPGTGPKQLALFHGETLVRRACLAATRSRLDRIALVIGHEAERVRAQACDLPVEIVENPSWAEGQSTSVRAGLLAVRSGADAALFLPIDQPLLDAAVIDTILDRFRALWAEVDHAARDAILVPIHAGRRGAPVLFGAALFDELLPLTGDSGGRQLVAAHPENVIEVELPSAAPLEDVDTLDEMLRLEALSPPQGP
ncbi:MAG TPA: nucleotidyltransferase family protein [Thermoanaerobaculia bacterium]|nr:nucleotidyltransferase family protein [Thermoanaerobaculia bacterium]